MCNENTSKSKTCIITYQAHSGKQPSYFSVFLRPTLVRKPIQLRLSSSDLCVVPRITTNIGTRNFALGAPSPRNMLPSCVKSVETIAKFRCHLKTYLYSLTYSS